MGSLSTLLSSLTHTLTHPYSSLYSHIRTHLYVYIRCTVLRVQNDHSHGDGTNDNNGVEIAILAENTVQPPPTPQEQQVFHDDDDDDVLGDDILCDLDNEEEDDLDDEDEDGNGRGRRRGVAIYVENDNEFIARHVDSEDIEGELSSDSLMMFVSNESQAVYVDNSNNSSNSNSGHSRKSDERREQGDQSFDSGDYNSNRRGGDAEDEETRQANSPISLFRQQDSNEYDDGEQQRLVQGQGPFMAKVEDDGPEFEKQQQQEEETQKDEIAHTQDSKKKNNKVRSFYWPFGPSVLKDGRVSLCD